MLRLMAQDPAAGQRGAGDDLQHDRDLHRRLPLGAATCWAQLTQIRDALVRSADKLNIAVVGGGTHPFQQWHEQRIYDKPRFRELSELYGYLSKQFTIFGQHVHIGCPDADAALLMLHRMSRYIPHFIALSASLALRAGAGHAVRFGAAELGVRLPDVGPRAVHARAGRSSSTFFAKTTRTGVVKSMKDFYWDIRPKPEFGTIEIRVFDTPLTVERAAALAGFVQSLAAWFLHEQPFMPQEDDYLVYTYNRFQACRFGLEAVYVDPATGEHMPLRDHILLTLDQMAPHARSARRGRRHRSCCAEDAEPGSNDARWLRETQARERLLAEVVRQAAERFRGPARLRKAAHGRIRPHRALLHAAGAPQPAGRGRRLRAARARARHAAGGVHRHAGGGPAFPVHRRSGAPGPQGAGGQPQRPGRLRRAAAGLHAGAGAAAGRRGLARRLLARACSRWPTRTAANWSAATPRAGR